MWIDPKTTRTFKTHNDIRLSYTHVSFPRQMTEADIAYVGLMPVSMVPRPAVDYTKNVTEGHPILQDGAWVQVWDVTDASAKEIDARERKMISDNKTQAELLLQQTDWTQLPDVDLLNKSEFKIYRDQVRAIALNPPVVVGEWPVKPEEIWSA